MEVIHFLPDWGYTLFIALVLVAVIVWRGRNFKIPAPRKKMGTPVKGYCDGCSKIVGGSCGVYASPDRKIGSDRGNMLGCGFSPTVALRPETPAEKQRVGQQKTRGKKSKKVTWKNYNNSKTEKKHGRLNDRLGVK